MTHHGHHHHHHGADGDGKRLLIAFAVIFIFMIVEAVGGLIAGSLALLADAGHMLTDALALAIAASAQWISNRPADHSRHFGYRRIQVLAAFANSIVLFLLLGWIVFEAITRLQQAPREVDWPLMLAVAFLGLVVNAVAFFVLHSAHRDNLNIRGAMLHVISDMLGSVAAIFAALSIAMTGWTKIDPILSILVAALIGRSAFFLLREAAHILMEGAPKDVDCGDLVSALKKEIPEIENIHDLRIWQLTPDETRLTMHLTLHQDDVAAPALGRIKQFLQEQYAIVHSTIQIEIGDYCPDRGRQAAAAGLFVPSAAPARAASGAGGDNGTAQPVAAPYASAQK